jgi:hypothetical protein
VIVRKSVFSRFLRRLSHAERHPALSEGETGKAPANPDRGMSGSAGETSRPVEQEEAAPYLQENVK